MSRYDLTDAQWEGSNRYSPRKNLQRAAQRRTIAGSSMAVTLLSANALPLYA